MRDQQLSEHVHVPFRRASRCQASAACRQVRVMTVFLLGALLGLIAALSTAAAEPAAGALQADDFGRQLRSLDGTWQIVFDEQNEGRAGGWHRQQVFSSLEDRRTIQVPSCWEEIKRDYEGVAFYGRRFVVPRSWKGKVVRLQFDAVNYIAEVWLNDRVVGRHAGGYGPFAFRVEDLLKFDQENFLSLRVIGPIVAQEKTIDGIGQNDMPHWRGAIAGGIWQSVRLIASGTAFVQDVFIEPQLADDTVKLHVALDNAAQAAQQIEVRLSIHPARQPEKIVAERSERLKLLPGRNRNSWTLALPDAHRWSPDDPFLYLARIRLEDGSSTLDEHEVSFGMRELTIRRNRFELNGKPIYIKAAFFEGLYPTHLAFPDSPRMARREIELAKAAGFNMIRPWRKPPPPMWLDLCDQLGMMVVGSMPIECMGRWPTVTPALRDRVENEVRSAILRDRNRACIVQWEIFNEILRPDLERLKHPMAILARRLDPTRLILDESGGFAGGSNIYLPYRFEPELFNDVHNYPGAPLNDASYDRLLALARTPEELQAMGLRSGRFSNRRTVPGRLTVVSEIGYGSLPDLVENNLRFAQSGNPLVPPYRYHQRLAESFRRVLKESGLDAVYPNLQKFCLDQQAIHAQGNKRMLEAIRSNERIGGYAVHALTGGDWVLGAGLLDLFRNPKGSYWGTKQANQPRYLALRVRPRNIYADKGARITVTGINDLAAVRGKLIVEVVSEDGGVVLRSAKQVQLATGISPLLETHLDARQLAGSYTARARLVVDDTSVLAQNEVQLDVLTTGQLAAPSATIAVLDTNNSLRPFLKKHGVAFEEFDAKTPVSRPVFVSKPVANRPATKDRFAALQAHVKRGGTAVYLEAVQRWPNNPFWGRQLPAELLPVRATVQQAKGLWVCVSHIVRDHPVFAGLPANCMMGQLYENVWAPQTLVGAEGELIVGSVSHGWHQGDKDAQNYLGPSDAWYGMDLGIVPYGQGRYVLSTLRIVDNLGRDPVADKILWNLIRWTAAQ